MELFSLPMVAVVDDQEPAVVAVRAVVNLTAAATLPASTLHCDGWNVQSVGVRVRAISRPATFCPDTWHGCDYGSAGGWLGMIDRMT